MVDLTIPGTETPTNVICITKAKSYKPGKCRHLSIIVDEALADVECADCGEKLNAVHIIARMAREQSTWMQNYQAMKEMAEALGKKQRCKCQHCGNFTKVRP